MRTGGDVGDGVDDDSDDDDDDGDDDDVYRRHKIIVSSPAVLRAHHIKAHPTCVVLISPQ